MTLNTKKGTGISFLGQEQRDPIRFGTTVPCKDIDNDIALKGSDSSYFISRFYQPEIISSVGLFNISTY